MARTHGSKPAALIRHLDTIVNKGEQVIVFSYWHDTLKLVQRTLKKVSLNSSFCDGRWMAHALESFTSGKVPILLLSGQSKASGANLQCATHVVILDPPGSSAEHGYSLEQQAVGRAVRMGQERAVTVTRFCVEGTLEQELFDQIDAAAKKGNAKTRSNYVIEDCSNKAVVTAKQPDSPASEDQNEPVEITAAISGEERMQQQLKEAEEKGEVITIDSDDEGSNIVSPATTVRPKEQVRVKRELLPKVLSPVKRARVEESVASTEFATESPSQPVSNRVTTVSPTTVDGDASPSPSSTGDNTTPPSFLAVKQLLSRFELTEYENQFLERGYDSVSWLYEVAQEMDVMEKIASDVGFKPGHAVRFQFRLAKESQGEGGATTGSRSRYV